MSDFFYQIGNVTTNKGWNRPTHKSVQSFLRDPKISHILEKYDDVLLIGGFLYAKDTWDLDLYLILNWDENTDWVAAESDLDLLNDTALNYHDLLLDIAISKKPNMIMTRHELIDHNKGKSIEDFTAPRVEGDDGHLVKLSRIVKIINGETEIDYNLIVNQSHIYGNVTALTDGYLCLIDRSKMNHNDKTKELIMRTLSSDFLNNLSYKTFLDMSYPTFLNSRNKLNETIQ
tara:strand:+ start:1264 stop:1956 length:693 start_codon:yes stop_codon:yes gene_type:complete